MFGLLDDIPLLGKRVAATVTRKGATMTAVAVAAPFVPAANLPIVAVLTGFPIKAALSSMVHNHREEKILRNYSQEIAATFGISADEVTHNHLRALAFGNEFEGIEPHPFFKEVLQYNDNNRWIALGASAIAAAGAIAFSVAQAATVDSGLFDSLQGFFESSPLGVVAQYAKECATVAWSVMVGAVLMATDYLAMAVGHDIFGSTQKTAYEKVEKLVKRQIDGKDITKEQVMDVIISANPELENLGFHHMRADARARIIAEYDNEYGISEAVAKINSGHMKINELAFIAIGERSGVPERANVPVEITEAQGMDQQPSPSLFQNVAHNAKTHTKQWRDELKQRNSTNQLVDEILQGKADTLHHPDMPGGSINFEMREKTRPLNAPSGAIERLEAERSVIPQHVTIH